MHGHGKISDLTKDFFKLIFKKNNPNIYHFKVLYID